ncbi:MAG: hypothetical protein D6704_08270 [Nitrospirae bacterium]|nr:MAG: hypothetical protein D6704_08270 [Nitrospirota bacterium]
MNRIAFQIVLVWVLGGFSAWELWLDDKPVHAEWTLKVEGKTFYTDDVGLFSASRRLSLREDPTQPVVDITNQGDDVVIEPVVTMGKAFTSRLGLTLIEFRGQGFVFADHSPFNHGTYGLRVTQTFSPKTKISLRYHYGPNLFLGNNKEQRSGSGKLVEERVSTHFWVGTVEREIAEHFRLRALARYGLRLYNDNFAQRDTRFWTIGPHLEWVFGPDMKWTMGYHYERGLADGRNQPQFNDDVSYINHYVTTELRIPVFERTLVELALHYERNNFTSTLPDDKRHDANENVWQGDIEIQHRISNALQLNGGIQRSQRKASFESETIIDINVWLGAAYEF